MKLFKASVIDKESKETVIIASEYPSKSAFIRDLRSNGYSVNPSKVKLASVFDWIIDNTECNPWDWTENN